MIRRVSTAVTALLSLAAVGCIRVDANVSGIVQAVGDQQFPGAGELAGTEMSHTFTVTLTPDNALVQKVATAQVQSLRLIPAAGVTSLDFFRGVKIVLRADQQADMTLSDAGQDRLIPSADGSITLPVVVDFDATKYLKDQLTIDATLDFMAPAPDWALGMEFTLSVAGGTTLGL
jgi:hypothetical protein